jgi:putative ABC transport system permease protein
MTRKRFVLALEWLYAGALRIYPSDFRKRFGREMIEAFRDTCNSFDAAGRRGRMLIYGAQAVLEVSLEGARARFPRLTRRSRPTPHDDRRTRITKTNPFRHATRIRDLAGDLRFGIRMIRKSPGVSFLAVLALGLGIGFTTLTFSIVYGSYMRGLPYDEADRLLNVRLHDPSSEREWLGPRLRDFAAWRAQTQTLEDLAAFAWTLVTLSDAANAPERYFGALVTPSTFPLLRVNVMMGRLFTEADAAPNAPRTAILAHSIWQNRFGGDPDIIGKTVRANGTPTTIIGVMPERFEFPEFQKLWLPLAAGRSDTLGVGVVFGRLRDGVDEAEAEAEFATFARHLLFEYREANEGITADVQPLARQFAQSEAVLMSSMILGAGLLLLIVACANVANLLFARAWVRTGEIAVRTALGASRSRVVSQMLAETLVLAVGGAGLGVVIAYVGVQWTTAAGAHEASAFWAEIKLDAVPLLVTVGVTLLAALFAGALPALRASRTDVNEFLKDGSLGVSSLRIGRVARSLVVVQVALSCGLLAVSSLMIKGIVQLGNVDLGFESNRFLTAAISLPPRDYPSVEEQQSFWNQLLTRLEAAPGVIAASYTSRLPGNSACCVRVAIEGRDYASERDWPRASGLVVHPNSFDLFNLNTLQGRLLDDRDGAERPPAVVVNESFVRRFYPEDEVLGRRIKLESDGPWITIVGVVPDHHMEGLESPYRGFPAGLYLPQAQNVSGYSYVVLQTRGEPLSLTHTLRDQIAGLDPDLPLINVQSMEEVVRQETFIYRAFAVFFTVAAAGGLFLATIGLYGVIALAMANRTREVGLRMALGAHPSALLYTLVKQSARELLIGLGLGTVLSLGLAKSMRILFYEVQPWDPAVLIGIVVAFALTGLAATIVPARRAMRVQPTVALRNQP